jgi:nitrate reductase beta subunit
VLVRLVAMRMHMRQRAVGDVDDTTLLRESGMTARDLEDMARLLGVAKYDERFVIPTARCEDIPDPEYLQGACGLEGIAPTEGIWPQSRINREREREIDRSRSDG